MAMPSSTATSADGRLTQAQRSALSDARMLDAAIQLIVKRGTAGTTLKEVGELAGYSRGLAGYRFGSKEGLFGFVVRSMGERWLQALTRATRDKVGLDAIAAATDAHYRFCKEAPAHVQAFYILWFESIGPASEAKAVIAGVHERRKKDVIQWIHKGMEQGRIPAGIDAELVASQFCSALVGIIYQWLVDPQAMEPIERLHEGLKRTMNILLAAQAHKGEPS